MAEQVPTVDKIMNCISGYAAQAERDGNLIAVLHKTASDSTEECGKLRTRLAELVTKNEELSKTASEQPEDTADKGVPELDDAVLRENLVKLSDDGVLDGATIDAHIQAAKEDPIGHMNKMFGVLQKELHRVKTASETELSPVGYPREGASRTTSARNTDGAFERSAQVQTSDALARLDSELETY